MALLDRAGAGRARGGDVEGQGHRASRRRGVADRHLRSGARHAVLADGESVARSDRRRSSGRQSVLGLDRRARREERAAEMAFPVHAARRLGL